MWMVEVGVGSNYTTVTGLGHRWGGVARFEVPLGLWLLMDDLDTDWMNRPSTMLFAIITGSSF